MIEIDCPVCGQKVEVFDVCEKCNWQNSGLEENKKSLQGPNNMSLKEARKEYQKGKKIC